MHAYVLWPGKKSGGREAEKPDYIFSGIFTFTLLGAKSNETGPCTSYY